MNISKIKSRAYLEKLRIRYRQAPRDEKGVILDEFTKTAGYTRKYAMHLMQGAYRHKETITRPRAKHYDESDSQVLVEVSRLLSWINSKRLKSEIGVAINSLVAAGKLVCYPEQKAKLLKISPSTIDRLLKDHRQRMFGRGRSYTKPGTLLKTQIPIRTFSEWDVGKVGFFEIDLCGHEGGVAAGKFAFTLNFVDVKTQWTEQVAVPSKSQKDVFAGIQQIRSRLPYPVLGIDSDSGSEFINHQLYQYCLKHHITFTRGRPGKKNDNPFVEAKNDSIVRRWVGYGRFDTQEQVSLLNEFYELFRLYSNFYLPVQKLVSRERVGSRVKKKYDKPATPFLRIMRHRRVRLEVTDRLMEQYRTLDLYEIKTRMDEILRRLKPTSVR